MNEHFGHDSDHAGGHGGFHPPDPYPPVEVSGPNRYYARILQEDMAGKVSEMTAVSQYSYHDLVTDNQEVGRLLRGIAVAEMHHLDILGRTIWLLGGNPRYRGYDGRFWTGDLVYYGVDIVDRITADIAAEKQAIQQYRYHQTLIADPCIQRTLERIIKDEMFHIVLFQETLQQYMSGSK